VHFLARSLQGGDAFGGADARLVDVSESSPRHRRR
jgi:hypothetical protein